MRYFMSEIFMMRDILRIITPQEINDLTTTSDGENRISLTYILDDEIDRIDLISQGMAKEANNILLFKKKRDFKSGNSCKRLFKFIQLENTVEVVLNFDLLNKKSKHKGDSTIDRRDNFLSAQESLREAQKKLKSAEVLQLYRKSSDISVEQVRSSHDDLSKSNNQGILINKKQA